VLTLDAAMGPNHGDLRPFVVARLLDINTVTNLAQVSIDGSDAVWLPFWPGTYTNITTVWVLRDPYNSGSGQVVAAPCYAEPPADVPPPPSAPPAPGTAEPAPTNRTALIRPTYSGTYRVIRSAWDRWNVNRYGGSSTLYQGDAFGSGTLIGLATYGNQVSALGALTISKIVVTTELATGSGNVTLQGSPHASRPAGAPSSSGSTSSGSSSVTLHSSICEGLRTGAFKGLCTVGANYRATYGKARATGMVMAVTYTRPA
jgi:hypothetical protein